MGFDLNLGKISAKHLRVKGGRCAAPELKTAGPNAGWQTFGPLADMAGYSLALDNLAQATQKPDRYFLDQRGLWR